jgi:hypothetical protein
MEVAKKIVYGRNFFIHQAVLKWLDDLPALTNQSIFYCLKLQ